MSFALVALSVPARQLFTYRVPAELDGAVRVDASLFPLHADPGDPALDRGLHAAETVGDLG